MKARPLRWLVLLPVLTAIAVGFLGFAVYLDRTEQASRIADLDEELARASRSVDQRPPGVREGVALPVLQAQSAAGSPVHLWLDETGQVERALADHPFDDTSIAAFASVDLGTGSLTLTDEATNRRVLILGTDQGHRQITSLSLVAVDAALTEFRRGLIGGGLLISMLVAVVVWLVTTAVTRPLTRLSDTAAMVAAGQIDARTHGPGGAREVNELASNFDSMVDRLQAALDRSERSTREAIDAREDMRRLLADVSHELRTPLTALKGYADLYAVGALAAAEDVDRAMARIGSESERLTTLTTDMLSLARHVPGDEMALQFDVASVVAAVIDDVRAARPGVAIRAELGSDLYVRGAPGRIHQAVLNLVMNGCHHGNSPDGLDVVAHRVGTDVEVLVIDHGPGISASDAERVFLPLYRTEDSRSRRTGVDSGAGLGLSVSKRIAEDHRGSVQLEPTPGGGATFTLRVPISIPNR